MSLLMEKRKQNTEGIGQTEVEHEGGKPSLVTIRGMEDADIDAVHTIVTSRQFQAGRKEMR